MEKFLANMYITIYDGMYSNAGIYNTLTLYSNAIMGSFSKSGVLHSAYLGIRTIAFGILIVYLEQKCKEEKPHRQSYLKLC